MMSSKQCRIVRSQRSKLLNAITQEEDPECWGLAQRLITRAKANDTGEGQNGINKILVRLKNMEKRLLGDSELIFIENSRYHHQKDLVGGRCTLTKVGLFKAVISSNDVYCLGVLERSHMMPIIMRLTFKYSFQEGTQIRPRFVEFLSSSDTSSPEAQALKIELMKAQSELGENVIWEVPPNIVWENVAMENSNQ